MRWRAMLVEIGRDARCDHTQPNDMDINERGEARGERRGKEESRKGGKRGK